MTSPATRAATAIDQAIVHNPQLDPHTLLALNTAHDNANRATNTTEATAAIDAAIDALIQANVPNEVTEELRTARATLAREATAAIADAVASEGEDGLRDAVHAFGEAFEGANPAAIRAAAEDVFRAIIAAITTIADTIRAVAAALNNPNPAVATAALLDADALDHDAAQATRFSFTTLPAATNARLAASLRALADALEEDPADADDPDLDAANAVAATTLDATIEALRAAGIDARAATEAAETARDTALLARMTANALDAT